jgi:hypothetical protein
MAVKFACSCGTQLRVAEKDAGRRIKCPKCGDILTSPSADSHAPDEDDEEERPVRRHRDEKEEGIQQSPRRRAAVADDEEDRPARRSRDEEEDDRDPDRDEEDRDRPARRKKKHPRKEKKAVWPIVLILTFVALLLFGGGGFGVWVLFFRGSAPTSDLAYIPPDAQGFTTVRMADLWKLDTTQRFMRFLGMQAGGNDPISELQRNVGLAAADIERLSLVNQDFEPDVSWMVILTIKPYDRKAILANFSNVKEVKHEGKTYHLGKIHSAEGAFIPAPPGMGPPGFFRGAPGSSQEAAIFFASPRVMIRADDNGMQRCLALAARKNPTCRLTDAIQQAGGKHYFFSTFTLNPAAQQKLASAGQQIPAPFRGLGSFLELTGGTIVSNAVGDPGFLDFKFSYADPGKATKAKTALTSLKATGQLTVPPLKPLLDGTTIDASGNDLKVRINLDGGVLQGLLPDPGGLPPQFDPPPGGKGRPKK